MISLGIVGSGARFARQIPFGISYPYLIQVVNPGFETGLIAPWAAVSGGAPFIINTPVSTGTSAATLPANERAWSGQTLDLPSEVHAEVDAGRLEATIACRIAGFSGGGGNDVGGLALDFRDGSSTRIGLSLGPVQAYNTETYADTSYTAMVPPGTRKITVGWWGYRNSSGTNCDIYVDDWQPLALNKRTKSFETVFRNAALATTGWTTVTGTLITNTGTLGLGGLCWNGATGDSYLPVNLPAGRYAAIDAGTADLFLDLVFSSFTDADGGRSYIEFYDVSNAIIGSRIYQEPADVNWNVNGEPRRYQLDIPANARSFRFGIVGTRFSGTELSSYFMEGRGTIES